MKQFQTTLSLITVSIILLSGCPSSEDGHLYIKIVNKSDIDIIYQNRINEKDDYFYCSTGGVTIFPYVLKDSIGILEAPMRSNGWEDYLDKGQLINIYIASAEVYNPYIAAPCDTIRKYVPILHRYQLKLEDLQRMNWTVVYPPEE